MNAVRSLSAVCEILYGGPAESLSKLKSPFTTAVPHKQLGSVIKEQVMDVLLKALDDYAIDNRGDVGSWVRESAMDALKRCSFLLCLETNGEWTKRELEEVSGDTDSSGLTTARSGPFFDEELMVKVVGGLAKQAVEKIDRVRDVAGRVLQNLLYSDQMNLDQIPHKRALEHLIPNDPNLNWAVRILTFPILFLFC